MRTGVSEVVLNVASCCQSKHAHAWPHTMPGHCVPVVTFA